MKKGILSMLSLAYLAVFISCDNQSVSDDAETRAVSISVTEAHHDLLDRLIEKNRVGELTFYADEKRTQAEENISESLGVKEIIQIPDVKFPGEFIDSVITSPYKTERFSKINLSGVFANGKLTEITAFSAEYELIVGGQNLGYITAFYLDPTEITKTKLIDELSGSPELNGTKMK